jgi:catecholate siderophore receptor
VIAGLRYDRFSVNFDDRRVLVPAVDLARIDSAVSPRAGLIWTPTAGSTYYASYSYAFLPSGEQLGLATTTADLAPERARNYEVGARWNLLPKLTLSAALYRTDRTDVRVADPVNIGFFVKSGLHRTQGIELGLQGEVTNDWQVYAAYSNMDGRVLKPITSGTTATVASITPAGNKIGLVPEQTLSLWNKFNLGSGWGTGLGVIHQSSSFTSFNNTVQLPEFTRVDGALYYAFDARTRLAFNVENLFDKKYFPTVDGDNNISPGAPRTFRLTLSTSF